jgi:HEAT repeat protein
MSYNAAWALGQMGDGDTKAQLARLLDDRSVKERTKLAVLNALGQSGDSTALLKAAREGQGQVAQTALQHLGRRGGPEADAALNEALASKDNEKRTIALQALAESGTPKSIDTISAALRDPELRSSAAQSLARIGGKKAFDALQDHYRRGDATDRQAIIGSLGHNPDPRGKALLLSALSDGDENVAGQAAQALSYNASREVKSRLLAVLQSSSSQTVRYRIASQLRWSDRRLYKENKELIDRVIGSSGSDDD